MARALNGAKLLEVLQYLNPSGCFLSNDLEREREIERSSHLEWRWYRTLSDST